MGEESRPLQHEGEDLRDRLIRISLAAAHQKWPDMGETRLVSDYITDTTEGDEAMRIRKPIKPCGETTSGAPKWMRCQLGKHHGGLFHIYADGVYTLQWANGEDGYVPKECPNPWAHDEEEWDD